jgi:hypothetical protein
MTTHVNGDLAQVKVSLVAALASTDDVEEAQRAGLRRLIDAAGEGRPLLPGGV